MLQLLRFLLPTLLPIECPTRVSILLLVSYIRNIFSYSTNSTGSSDCSLRGLPLQRVAVAISHLADHSITIAATGIWRYRNYCRFRC